MKYIKMFIAGIAFPSTLLPFLLLIAVPFGKPQVLTIPFLHFIPLIWGVWNILYFTCFFKMLPENTTTRLLLTGGVLGFLVAVYGVFGLHIPAILGFPQPLTYLPLVIAPILYAVLWLFIVEPLNHLLGIYEEQSK